MNRYIIIKYQEENYAKEQMKIFIDNKELFRTKKLKVKLIKNNINKILLIGFDGDIKLKTNKINPKEIIDLINIMPMANF